MTRLQVAKLSLFAILALPTLQVAYVAFGGSYIRGTQAQTILEISGVWSMWMLVAVLAIRPARDIYSLPSLIRHRRMVGLYAAWYGLIHTAAYIYDNDYRWAFIWDEVVRHPFLSTGTIAIILLVPLVATSTDAMVRRLGGRAWRRLQQIVYIVLIVAVVHYVLSVRLSPSEPILQAGLLGWMLHYRLIVFVRRRARRPTALGPNELILTAMGWILVTGLVEMLYFKVNTTVSLVTVAQSYLSPIGDVRPAITATVIFIIAIGLKLTQKRLIGSKSVRQD